jgi:solute carrier family 31 (copper transporter), member 1
MLWNWYTIDACFIARSWHVRSSGAFAGSCIGVILLVIALECLRRGQREFDRYLRLPRARNGSETGSGTGSGNDASGTAKTSQIKVAGLGLPSWGATSNTLQLKLWQHAVRCFLYTAQFAVGYFIMLLAMYYNGESYIQITFFGRSLTDGPWALLPGYIIICILIGAFLGAMIFQWDTFDTHL